MRERAGGLERHSTRICIQRLQEADCCESVTRTASVHHRVTVCTAGCCNSAVAAAVGLVRRSWQRVMGCARPYRRVQIADDPVAGQFSVNGWRALARRSPSLPLTTRITPGASWWGRGYWSYSLQYFQAQCILHLRPPRVSIKPLPRSRFMATSSFRNRNA